jgi:hypothetical protein
MPAGQTDYRQQSAFKQVTSLTSQGILRPITVRRLPTRVTGLLECTNAGPAGEVYGLSGGPRFFARHTERRNSEG